MGTAGALTAEVASSYGYYPRVATEAPPSALGGYSPKTETIALLRQPTRFQAVYLASELADTHFVVS